MDAQNVMEEWEVSPFDGGFDGLRDLESRRFSGAVEAGGSRLFFRDGDPLAAVADLEVDPRPGDVDAFEGASGQVHEATHPATASLAAMLALDGEVRGQYFTEDTPLSTVHETLSEGGFTGYVELSENVLSGDYYVVYEDGEEDYLGVLGSSQRLITDEEAQSKAEGEVGIYSVVAVSLPGVEIPRAESTAADAGDGAAGAGVSENGGDTVDSATVDEPREVESGPSLELDADDVDDNGATAETPSEPEPEAEPASGTDSGPAGTAVEPQPESDAGQEPETEPDSASRPETETPSEPQPAAGSEHEPSDPIEPNGADAGTASDRVADSGDSMLEGVTTRSVPSLDPERTGRAESSRRTSDAGTGGAASAAAEEPARRPEPEPEPDRSSEPEAEAEPDQGGAQADRIEEIREEYEARIEELESELRSLREERDRLQERVSTLEASESTGAASGGPTLSPAEALAGTSLFVREGTRGEATLEDAHAGRTDRETLAKNLRVEYHTQFDDGEATVDGQPFEAWLRSSAPYDFVEWLITDLLFEIQSTGASSALRPLYDAIPRIDRVGFEDPITVGEGEETREMAFDVVARNQMGEPLVAATIDEGRDPTRAESLQPLIGDAEDVALEHDTLAATFSVTSSYFEPDALDAAREATSGSLLGREKYRSYVKLARKQGFHLCLVESREESFHLAVPEL